MSILWHDGEWKEDSQPVFPFNDRIRYGDGVYDTLLIVDGTPIDIENHFKRLQQSAQVFAMDIPFGINAFKEHLQDLIQKNEWPNGQVAVNTLITRGPSKRGLRIPEQATPNVIIRGAALPEMTIPPRALITSKTVRRNEYSPLARIKSCNYGDNILALIEAENKGADDALLLNTKGHLACATTSNVFIVQGEKIKTPPLTAGVLDGTLRRKVIAQYAATEINITEGDLDAADDIILTNSVLGIRRASSLNGRTLKGSDLEFDPVLHLK